MTQAAMNTNEQHRAKILRFGLMAIPPIAWGVAFAPLFLLSNGLHLDWITLALIPSLIEAAVVGVVCYIVWFAYKRLILHPAL
jgi:hypothetical protein